MKPTMGKRDERFDVYIADAADFAQPILIHLREVVHTACPDVEEAMKWSHPHFTYKGMLCMMAAFKQHCTFGFWKAALIVDGETLENADAAYGQFGRLTSVKQLPSKKVLSRYIKLAMKLNEDGISPPRKESVAKKAGAAKTTLRPPADLKLALDRNRKALNTFDAFSPSQRKEYIDWITEAKAIETRSRRLEQAIEWMAEGKQRHWKYQK
ncbi:MAG: YdeI/OmpD-associated family protein [Gemmatimonas sp.]